MAASTVCGFRLRAQNPRIHYVAKGSHIQLRILSVADLEKNPNSGAAGTVLQTNNALRELGHSVDELWATQLGKRWIEHGNLHSLLEQPIKYRNAVRRAWQNKQYDIVLSQQPQSYLAAHDHRTSNRAGMFFTVSQGVEARISPILEAWKVKLGDERKGFPRRVLSFALQKALARQWPAAARSSDGVIVQHNEDKRFICQTLGLSEQLVHVWPSGVEPLFLSHPVAPMTEARMKRMLFVGQFAFFKGPAILAKIVNAVLARNSEVTFTWLCDKRDHEAAMKLIKPEVRNRVSMQGWVKQLDLLEILDTHGLFVFPTIAEGFAKAPLEAMSRGLCVVASNCCGMADYIENAVSGYLAPVGNVDEFTKAIDILFSDHSKSKAVSNAARLAALQYTWQKSAKGLVEYILGHPKKSPDCVR